MMKDDKNKNVVFGDAWISIDDVMQIAHDKAAVKLNDKPAYINKINNGVQLLEDTLKNDGVIYGVTTGYGDSCTRVVPSKLVNELKSQILSGAGFLTNSSHFVPGNFQSIQDAIPSINTQRLITVPISPSKKKLLTRSTRILKCIQI